MGRDLLRAAALVVCVLFLCALCGQALADDKLKRFKKSVGADDSEEKEKPKPKIETETPSSSDDGEIEDEDEDEDLWNIFLAAVFGEMFESLGEAIFGDHGIRYRAYPYSKENYAFYDIDRDPRGAPGVFRAEYQRMNPDLYSLTWRMTLRMSSGFDFSITDTYYDERLRSHDHERMKYTRFRLNYLLAPLPGNILIRPGVGFALLEDLSGLDIGIEIEAFAQEPFIIRMGVSHTFLTNHHGVSDIDIALGVMAGPVEFALGYRGLITRDESIDGAYFSVGFWF